MSTDVYRIVYTVLFFGQSEFPPPDELLLKFLDSVLAHLVHKREMSSLDPGCQSRWR